MFHRVSRHLGQEDDTQNGYGRGWLISALPIPRSCRRLKDCRRANTEHPDQGRDVTGGVEIGN
jgi:hypothetical protein